MTELSPAEKKKERKLIVIWSVTFLVLFPFLVVLGYMMRLNQAERIHLGMDTFYTLLTLHGLGMAGILFSISFAALWYLIATRYARLKTGIGYFVYALIVIGFALLAFATLVGKFGAGWYVLYPLPFKGTFWAPWATGLACASLLTMGVAWLVGIIHVVSNLAREYGGFTNLLGWQYFKKGGVKRELPPVVMITTISTVPGVIAFLTGAVMLVMYVLQIFEPTLNYDPLLMKNMVMFFGHTLVNITLYCCTGWVYCLLPEFTGRPWKSDKIVVLSWNATFIFILFAYFHHLYMDFAQPVALQYAGQFISYLSAVPATAVTLFGLLAQLYHSKIKWSAVPLSFLAGGAGWAIGGFAAVVDSTIAVNTVLHNTTWVPAHFHTYMLMGVVFFIFGFIFYISHTKEELDKDILGRVGLWIFAISGHSFIATFYRGGLRSIPRRYSDYSGIPIEHVHQTGMFLAFMAVIFITIIFVALVIIYTALFKKFAKRRHALVMEPAAA